MASLRNQISVVLHAETQAVLAQRRSATMATQLDKFIKVLEMLQRHAAN